jgi:hypothetical protein
MRLGFITTVSIVCIASKVDASNVDFLFLSIRYKYFKEKFKIGGENFAEH